MARNARSKGALSNAKEALRIVAEPSLEAAVEKLLLDPAHVERLHRRFTRNAHRAFFPAELKMCIAALAAGRPERSLTAIQAGANDGKDDDPIFPLIQRYFGKIVLVEPQPQLIPALNASYADFAGEAIVENVAVATGGELVMHIPNAEADIRYRAHRRHSASAIASFDRAYVIDRVSKGCQIPVEAADRMIDAVTVPTMTIEELANKHLPGGVDLLQVDCEGYDWSVIKTVGAIRPAIINFEANKLPEGHWEEWADWASDNRYGFVSNRRDTMAIRNLEA